VTSREITSIRGAAPDNPSSDHNALWEIALQLAIMNEHNSLADPEPGKKDAESTAAELWPKIEPYGAIWALWLHPLAEPKFFDTERDAQEYIRGMAQRMNDYVPPLKNAKHPYTSTACQHALHDRCRKSCKFCASPCMCSCHEKKSDSLADPEPAKKDAEASAAGVPYRWRELLQVRHFFMTEARINVCSIFSTDCLRGLWADLMRGRRTVTDALAQYAIHRYSPLYRPGGLALPVIYVRGKTKAMQRREELQKALTEREKSWGFGYYLVKQ
jgi:hypothetical protein